jgi:hypothetical protein
MRVVMTLLVRNEGDIIRENIEFHKEMGVDYFIVTDHGSTDNTGEILGGYKDIMSIKRIEYKGYNQGEWVSEMAREAYNKYKADWVINNDADEFWYVKGGYKEYFSKIREDTYKIHINRYDFYYIEDILDRGTKFYNRLLYREVRRRWTKCCHRGMYDAEVEMGNHNVYSRYYEERGYRGVVDDTTGIKIYHYPVRDINRYKNKIIDSYENLRSTLNISEEKGFHWRNAYNYINRGGDIRDTILILRSNKDIEDKIKNNEIIYDDTIQGVLSKI